MWIPRSGGEPQHSWPERGTRAGAGEWSSASCLRRIVQRVSAIVDVKGDSLTYEGEAFALRSLIDLRVTDLAERDCLIPDRRSGIVSGSLESVLCGVRH